MDHVCHLCSVFIMLSCLFIVALWSPADKSWPLGSLVCHVCVLSLSHVVPWVRCGA